MCDPDALPGSGYGDKALEAVLLAACRRALEEKVAPGAWAQQRVGNAYTASLYIGLARLWEYEGRMLEGKRLLLFSFGSGVMSTLFSLVARRCEGGEFTLERVAANMGLAQRLSRGRCCTPEEYDAALAQRAVNWEAAGYTPQTSVADLEPGTWYLSQVDAQHRRVYTRKPRPAPYQTDQAAASTCSSTPSTTVQQAMG
ncbi:hypothetical protein QJQ45_003253 [Haematococcus lacustris]|nr:hypothetical protein QJQ45_003253 [Haematococcus lacustris]